MRQNKKIIKIKKNNIIVFFLLIAMLEPAFFKTIPVIDYAFGVMKLVSMIFLVIILKRYPIKEIDFFFVSIILYKLYIVINTFVQMQAIQSACIDAVYVIFFLVLIKTQFIEISDFMYLLYWWVRVLVYANLFSYLIAPSGLYENIYGWSCYILGYRNVATQFIFPMIGLSYYIYKIQRKKFASMIVDVIVGLAFPILSGSATGILCSVIVTILCGMDLRFPVFIKKIKVTYIFIVGIIVSCLILFFNIQNNFSTFFREYFERDITFSGRTYLWIKLEDVIRYNPVFGYGYTTNLNEMTGYVWAAHAHNNFLQEMIIGGVVGCILYGLTLFSAAWKYDKATRNSNQIMIIMCGFMIGFQVEVYSSPIFYMILIVMHYWGVESQKSEKILMQ